MIENLCTLGANDSSNTYTNKTLIYTLINANINKIYKGHFYS